MTISEPLLRVRDLSVTFPPRRGHPSVRAVDGVSFDLMPGETLGLVGESGSGKTTTGRAVLQLQPTTGGAVQLLGRDLSTMSRPHVRAMRRHMQFVQQNPYSSLHPRMTIGHILAEPLRVHHSVTPAAVSDRVVELLDLVGMEPGSVDRYPHEFSGGQRQRIVIARALAVNPDLVVCDEPVSALDVRIQAQIVSLLKSLQEEFGLSYIFVAHDLAVVRRIAHRVAVMYRGHIVEIGDADSLYEYPVHPYTRSLMDAIPIPDPVIQRKRLADAPAEMQFLALGLAANPCVFGENHIETGTPYSHQISDGRVVSCEFWPQGAKPELPPVDSAETR